MSMTAPRATAGKGCLGNGKHIESTPTPRRVGWWKARPTGAVVVTLPLFVSGMGAAAAAEPSYRFELLMSRNNDVCTHMTLVLNRTFKEMWSAPPLLSVADSNYGHGSRFSFPTLLGVTATPSDTFAMRYSRQPSSTEFDAIDWQEGLVSTDEASNAPGGPRIASTRHVLIAHFDFDNDGAADTVIKYGFSPGYSAMAYGSGGDGQNAERLAVWRGKNVSIDDTPSWNALLASADDVVKRPVLANASYLRPFIYKNITYAVEYSIDLGPNFDATEKPPYRPRGETMRVVNFAAKSIMSAGGPPSWRPSNVCSFRVVQTSSSGN